MATEEDWRYVICIVVHDMTCSIVFCVMALDTAQLGVGACIPRFTKWFLYLWALVTDGCILGAATAKWGDH